MSSEHGRTQSQCNVAVTEDRCLQALRLLSRAFPLTELVDEM